MKKAAFQALTRNPFIVSLTIFGLLIATSALAQGESVELNGDTVEYSANGNTVIARGNVEIKYETTTLIADEVEFDRDTQIAYAKGDVTLITPTGEISGDKITFNFETMQGQFNNARIMSHPYYGFARKVKRVSDDHLILEDGYITTSDYDKPEYRVTSKKIDVYPGDKLVARNVKLKAGQVPLFYSPWYKHNLQDEEPRFVVIPGYEGDWGGFVLGTFNHRFNDQVKMAVHADYRDRLGIGGGIDLAYENADYGKGLIRTYYTGEEDENFTPSINRDRYKVEWRHKWDLDEKTTALWQYYKLSDSEFLKDYFEREYEDDTAPNSFITLTRALPKGVLSLRADVRVNRFENKVERLPELRYTLNSQEIFDSGFYIKNTTTYSNLYEKTASTSDSQFKTHRFDSDSELSYPTKIGFLEFKPFIGGRSQFYTEGLNDEDDNSFRGIFRTGASLSTKFYKIYNVDHDLFGEEVSKMRHIVSPSIDYLFQDDPTFGNEKINQFDSLDSQTNAHLVTLSLENKLQIKRGEETVELVRAVVSTPFEFKQNPGTGGFDVISTDIDLKPADWLSIYFDSKYDPHDRELDTANFDMFINGRKWRFGLGRRYNRLADDQITAEFNYRINSKWLFKAYERFDIESGRLKDQSYLLRRDLHSWEMDMIFSDSRADGQQILMAFRLKAFPEIGFDFGNTISERRGDSVSE